MKRLYLFLALIATIFAFAPGCFALDPEECGSPSGRFTDFSFVSSNLKQAENPKLKSDFGVSFTKGNTYYLHKPIAGLLRFGIDAEWFDFTYANYKVNEINITTLDIYKYSINELDLCMGIGISATVNLFKKLQATAYFRYNPTYQMMLNDSRFQGGFANLFTSGINVTYARVGLGIEARFGHSKMKTFIDWGDVEDIEEIGDLFPADKNKLSTAISGLRAYICLRF